MTRLYLDDCRNPPDDSWTLCRTVAEAQALLAAGNVIDASLDHDLGMVETSPGVWSEVEAPTGYDLCVWMIETGTWPANPPRCHSANPAGRAAIVQAVDRFFGCPPGGW